MASSTKWRPVSLAFWILLGAFLCQVNCDGQPSLSDCQPHIDAKIKEMSSKTKKSKGSSVTEDGQQAAEQAAYQYEQQYQQYQQYQQQYQPPPPAQYQQPQAQYQQPQQQPQQQQYQQQQYQQQQYQQQQYQPQPQAQYQPQQASVADEGQEQGRYVETQQQQYYQPAAAVPQSQDVPVQYTAPPPQYAEPVPQPQADYQQYAPVQQPPAAPQYQQYSPPPTPQVQPKLGFIDKWMTVLFGPVSFERNPKFARPWGTHPEFKTRFEIGKSSSEPVSKKVDSTPGFIGNLCNKFIGTVFVIPTNPRDPKFATPWQSHKEHTRVAKATDAKPVRHESYFKFTLLNKFVETIFGKVTGERSAKFAEPWQTHPEHQRKAVPETEGKKVKVDTSSVIGDSLNSFIYMIFSKPSGERHPKFAEPWQTHPELKRKAVPESNEPVKIDTGPGFIGKRLNNFIYMIFPEPKTSRNPKFAQPWKTHPEHCNKGKVEKEVTGPVKQDGGLFGFKYAFLNSGIEVIFGTVSKEREEKWQQPWQTHPEHNLKKESAHSRPAPAAPSHQQYQPPPQYRAPPPPQYHGPPPPQQAYQPPQQAYQPPQQAYQPPPQAYQPPPQAYQPPPPPPKVEQPPPPPAPKVEQPPPPPPAPKVEQPPPPPAPKVEQAPPPPAPKVEQPPPPPPTPAPKKEVPAPEPIKKQAETRSFPTETETVPTKAYVPPTPPPVREPVADAPKAPVKPILEEPKRQAIPETQEPISAPSTIRSRDHIDSILGLDEMSHITIARTAPIADASLRDLKKIYETSIQPLENTFKYKDISNRHLSEAELFGTPLVLLLGPYSTGKSSFINYVLGIEYTKRALQTGNPPSHGAFRIVQYGDHDRNLDGTDISGHPSFSSLQKFGQNFVDQISGKALNLPLLKKVSFVEVPGILEVRRPGERLYPFNDVAQWFIDRADLILVMFDYTKLDAGYEMEALLDQLKGREAQTRILLNKADKVPSEELIKVQGSLFWNLSPLLGVNSPPTVYAGSFASIPYRQGSAIRLFEAQEEALLHDMSKAISSRVENRIAIARRHAVRVKSHAQMVDTYLSTYYRNKGFLTSKHKLAEEITENPHAYNIYEGMSLLTNVSRYDLPDAEIYRDFFRVHNLYDFHTLRETCTFLGGCPQEKINSAISRELPELVTRHRRLVEAAELTVRLPKANMKQGMGAGVATNHQRTTA